MSLPSLYTEKELLARIKSDDHSAFSILFRSYYKDLVFYGGSILAEKEVVEDIIQNLFLKLWNDRKQLTIEISLKSFLLKAVKNSCLDEIRHRDIINKHQEFILQTHSYIGYDTDNYVFQSELRNRLNEAIHKLPQSLKETFELSRIRGMKYKDIAERQNVSVRTVEVRISKALNLLRFFLKDLLALLIFFKIH